MSHIFINQNDKKILNMINLIYIEGGEKHCRPLTSREEFVSYCNSDANRQNWNLYRSTGDDKYKRQLVQVAYNCQPTEGSLLKGNKTVSPFFFHDIDCRDAEECRRIMAQLLAMKDELGLLEISESASHGVHTVGRREKGRTILESQVNLAMKIRLEMDTNNKENNRVVFHGPVDEETTPLLDEALFAEQLTDEEASAEYLSLKEREKKGEEQVPPGAKKANKHYRPWEDGQPVVPPVDTPNNDPAGQRAGTGPAPTSEEADERTIFIVRECLKEAGLEEKDLNTPGGIHNSVKSMLSVGATQLLTQGELMGVLKELMPQYWQEKNIVQLVSDFYSKYTDTSQKMNQFQRRLFARSRKIGNEDSEQTAKGDADKCENVSLQDDSQPPVYGDIASLTDIYNSPCPPLLSSRARPAFVKAATAPVPAECKETAAQAMFPPLGMYCDACFVYDDGTPREPRLNCLITAGTGSGKDSSTKHMLQHLEAPRQQDDEPNRKILADWKAECKRLESKNEDKPPRPNVAVRSVAANITQARLSELMADSQGRIIHTRMIEFDQWFSVEGWKPGTNCPFTYLKMTDDEGNPFGQERVGKDSITYRGPLSINWNASTTTAKAQYYFRNVMTDGPISRLCLATTPDRGLGAPMPKHGKYDEKYDESLKPFIDNLRKVQGLINCKQAVRMVRQLKKELDEFAVKTGDAVFDNLGHRALVIVFRKACLLYAANGLKWERSIEGFCRWSLHYDMWLKLHFFGDLIRSADGEVKTSHRGPRNLLEQLPEEFTRQDVVNVRQLAGKDAEGTSQMLAQWKFRGYILQITDYSFKKVPSKNENTCSK